MCLKQSALWVTGAFVSNVEFRVINGSCRRIDTEKKLGPCIIDVVTDLRRRFWKSYDGGAAESIPIF